MTEYRTEIDTVVSTWVDHDNNNKGLNTFLNDTVKIYDDDMKDRIDHGNIRHHIARYQVP